MEPFTATNLRPRKSNSIKDFVAVTGVLHVSHMVILTQTVLSPYLRIIRVPRGPTLTFKIHNYTLSTDVLSSLRKQYAFNKIFLNSPLVVLNGFTGDDPHIKLMVATFQGMFPTINITTVNLKSISRCVLFNYNKDTKMIDFRHYVIRSRPLGISKAVKKLGRNKIPDLSRYKDVSEFITKSDLLSDSEVEDDPGSHVSLPQTLGPRSTKGNRAAVRLTEYGPRMTLQLIKVEAGIMEGEVLFHEYVQKTEEEKELIRKRLEEKKKLKEKRRKEQLANVKKKEQAKEEAKQKSLEGMKKAGINVNAAGETVKEDEPDDDAEWYRQEVGEEPDPELFQMPQKKSILKRKRDDDGGDSSALPKRLRKDVHKKSVRFSGMPNKMANKKNIQQPPRKSAKKQMGGKRKGKGRKNMGTRVTKGKRH
ncbi:protein Peter pan isoform X2 [Halyomorpha halys]|nr:protein Peter pan isoform X2 [Halyomorpha halys]XP_024214420.1 protein Peter pan isoform X2 [Halyomorpha halys]